MTASHASRLVLPGELLGTAEEFVPGHGTYEEQGRVYAALLGSTHVDANDRSVSVRAVHAIPHLGEGDLVYARVDELKSQMAIVTLLSDASTNRAVPGTPEATIHISKAKEGYTDSLNEAFSTGDIVLAKVLQAQPTVKLTTAPASLGVVAARCHSCHGILAGGDRGLHCPRCGATETRKMSHSYGTLHAPLKARAPGGHHAGSH
ncbi:MAG: exosome complex RNA-binding protein Csl4 [Thermoplasmata archaeon]|nr:exosome complex RNA-binding protein Csl4 [Thermoplasmata archaeon]